MGSKLAYLPSLVASRAGLVGDAGWMAVRSVGMSVGGHDEIDGPFLLLVSQSKHILFQSFPDVIA